MKVLPTGQLSKTRAADIRPFSTFGTERDKWKGGANSKKK